MTKHFKRVMQDVRAYSKFLDQIEDIAVELGLDRETANTHNAVQKIISSLQKLLEVEKSAEEMGYSSVRVALKALGQMKGHGEYDISKLPECFHRPPQIWLDGRAETKVKRGFPRMKVREAERRHRALVPLLIEAWALAEGEEKVQNEIEKEYRTAHVDDFERAVYEFIYRLEPVSPEDEFEERALLQAREVEEFERAQKERRSLEDLL